jgi:hypothetical protein
MEHIFNIMKDRDHVLEHILNFTTIYIITGDVAWIEMNKCICTQRNKLEYM